MAKTIDIRVPELGDFSDVEIIEVLVNPGDAVEREGGLIVLETDKATMDVPAPEEGVIEAITVAVGERVNSGDVIGRMTVAGGDEAAPDTDSLRDPTGDTVVLTDIPEDTADAAALAEVVTPGGEQTLVVPDIGDFSNVDVIEVHVAAGDTVSVDDSLITLETDKAAMDVPAVVAGTIRAVLVKAGDKVSQGSEIAVIDAVAQSTSAAAQLAAGKTPAPAQAAKPAAAQAPKAAPEQPPAATPARPATIDEAGFARAHASPSVRKLARELGVDLARVKGTGTKNRILHDDVKAWVKQVLTSGAAGGGPSLPKVPVVDFAKFGPVDVKPLTRIQKISGPRLQASWINLPHVTQHDLADITDLEARRQQLKGPAKARGISLTPLAFIMKACVAALTEFPKVNASLSEDGESLVFKQYIHLGFAADTDQGLMVPVIRDVDKKDVYEIARELGELSALARDGKLKADQMQGATFTISSLGGIGGTAFTPIVNAPEVAILGVSKSSMQPVWDGNTFVPRLMLPLSFSYDHRVIDGAQAVRFTTYLGAALADIDKLLQDVS